MKPPGPKRSPDWELVSKDAEMKQGKNIADACKDTGVKHLIWSSLPNATQGMKLTSSEIFQHAVSHTL